MNELSPDAVPTTKLKQSKKREIYPYDKDDMLAYHGNHNWIRANLNNPLPGFTFGLWIYIKSLIDLCNHLNSRIA